MRRLPGVGERRVPVCTDAGDARSEVATVNDDDLQRLDTSRVEKPLNTSVSTARPPV